MELQKFIKITGIVLSFVNFVPSYGDRAIITILPQDSTDRIRGKVNDALTRVDEIEYYIRDFDMLKKFLEISGNLLMVIVR